MKVDDLVVLEFKGLKKIGIVRKMSRDGWLLNVFWSDGDQTWCMEEQVELLGESR